MNEMKFLMLQLLQTFVINFLGNADYIAILYAK